MPFENIKKELEADCESEINEFRVARTTSVRRSRQSIQLPAIINIGRRTGRDISAQMLLSLRDPDDVRATLKRVARPILAGCRQAQDAVREH
ncbi:hypothetical protein Pan189_13650 [Stratiformator vulcanicus]|uniref:Uncharacterized protein n=1 Tax=Stratiformator vulcanicus TaxID=2527980 RepID=A0A517QZM7_9PLAN|nr:hypothetical protein Pan189_13650 [Stratiformator vulcanicus]